MKHLSVNKSLIGRCLLRVSSWRVKLSVTLVILICQSSLFAADKVLKLSGLESSYEAGEAILFDVSIDNDPGASLQASGLPPGAHFLDNNNGTGTFFWFTQPQHSGDYALTIKAKHSNGRELSRKVSLSLK